MRTAKPIPWPIPITDLETVIREPFLRAWETITAENKSNANRIYLLALYGPAAVPGGGNGLPPGVSMGDGSFAALMAEATKYIGSPYVWGGSSPSTSFDCSGYVCWVYTHSGVYSLPRTTATGIYDQCSLVPKAEMQPGDLLFFIPHLCLSGTGEPRWDLCRGRADASRGQSHRLRRYQFRLLD